VLMGSAAGFSSAQVIPGYARRTIAASRHAVNRVHNVRWVRVNMLSPFLWGIVPYGKVTLWIANMISCSAQYIMPPYTARLYNY